MELPYYRVEKRIYFNSTDPQHTCMKVEYQDFQTHEEATKVFINLHDTAMVRDDRYVTHINGPIIFVLNKDGQIEETYEYQVMQ